MNAEGRIRTYETTGVTVFETVPFDHFGTSAKKMVEPTGGVQPNVGKSNNQIVGYHKNHPITNPV